tara:strand:+ start:4493 stop:4960 length:468 start_codon:yes stop_codon:yes gene_type:complete
MKRHILALSLAACSTLATAHTQESVEQAEPSRSAEQIEAMVTGRYTSVKNIAPMDQLNPLKVVIKTKLPQSIQTVRQAVGFLLVRSGYSLADDAVLSEEAVTLLDLPLPQIHRQLGPITLDKALQTLSGQAFVLVVDPVHRKVGYELSVNVKRAG